MIRFESFPHDELPCSPWSPRLLRAKESGRATARAVGCEPEPRDTKMRNGVVPRSCAHALSAEPKPVESRLHAAGTMHLHALGIRRAPIFDELSCLGIGRYMTRHGGAAGADA